MREASLTRSRRQEIRACKHAPCRAETRACKHAPHLILARYQDCQSRADRIENWAIRASFYRSITWRPPWEVWPRSPRARTERGPATDCFPVRRAARNRELPKSGPAVAGVPAATAGRTCPSVPHGAVRERKYICSAGPLSSLSWAGHATLSEPGDADKMRQARPRARSPDRYIHAVGHGQNNPNKDPFTIFTISCGTGYSRFATRARNERRAAPGGG